MNIVELDKKMQAALKSMAHETKEELNAFELLDDDAQREYLTDLLYELERHQFYALLDFKHLMIKYLKELR